MNGNQGLPCWNIRPERTFDSDLSFINDSKWEPFGCQLGTDGNPIGWCNQNSFSRENRA